VLSERRTGAALGDMHDRLDLLDTGATTRAGLRSSDQISRTAFCCGP
jgi:hypothetical protein